MDSMMATPGWAPILWTWDPAGLQLFRDARTKAFDAIESAKQLYYYERLKTFHDSKLLWNELCNLGLCSNGLDAPSIFATEQLNQHFTGISNDPLAEAVDGFFAGLEGEFEIFSLFSLSQVTFQEVSKAVAHFSIEARGVDDVPKSVVTAAFPVIRVYLLNIFNTSIHESIFPSAWKKYFLRSTKSHRHVLFLKGLLRIQIEGFWFH